MNRCCSRRRVSACEGFMTRNAVVNSHAAWGRVSDDAIAPPAAPSVAIVPMNCRALARLKMSASRSLARLAGGLSLGRAPMY